MTSITLPIDEKILSRWRAYAENRHTPFEQFVCELIEREIKPAPAPTETESAAKIAAADEWIKHWRELGDRAQGCSDGKKWTREELYERR